MKKKFFYPTLLALILGSIMVISPLSAQYVADNDVINFNFEILTPEAEDVEGVNVDAITEISEELAYQLNYLKSVMEINYVGQVVMEVYVARDGIIFGSKVIEGGNDSINELLEGIVNEMEYVTPITYKGVAQSKTVLIPVRFEK